MRVTDAEREADTGRLASQVSYLLITSPPTWKAGCADRLPHSALNSAEKRRLCTPLLSFHSETTQKMKWDHVLLIGFPCRLEGK